VFRAVVFAYSEVGLRCLEALLEQRVQVPLVFTYEDAASEAIWFGSVARLARERGIETVTPSDPNTEEWIRRVAALAPDYLFSFYYRSMLDARLLACARRGALNMHGSLLPKYRGRAPINWAILNGETSTGVTLHYMVAKPDAGPIVAQEVVPIGIDDTALAVSLAAAGAAAALLARTVPVLAAGAPVGRAMDLTQGSYCRGRRPEDGRIEATWPAARIHAMIRAVAPPFPGAFVEVGSHRILFAQSQWTGQSAAQPGRACLYVDRDGRLYLDCMDGLRLHVPRIAIDGRALIAEDFARLYRDAPLHLDTTSLKGSRS
jgi:methionyl-tRNA formyltransferase